MKVSFDFDSTLTEKDVFNYATELVNRGIEVWIVTSRFSREEYIKNFNRMLDLSGNPVNADLFNIANHIGIPKDRIHFTNMQDKYNFFIGKDFIFHVDDDWVENELIIKHTQTVPIDPHSTGWQDKCEKLLTEKDTPTEIITEGRIHGDKELFEKFKEIMLEVHDSKDHDPFFELNERLNKHGIFLIDHEKYFETVPPEEKREFKHANMIPELGIRILSFDSPSRQLRLIVDDTFDDKFINIPRHHLKNILNRLWSGFGHETIHKQQVDRMKKVQEPSFFSKEQYFSNKQEIMAMAFSFVEELRSMHSDEEILNFLRKGKRDMEIRGMPMRRGIPAPSGFIHPLYNIYKDIGGKAFKLFLKYAYQYLLTEKK